VNGQINGVEKAFYPNGDKMITFTYQNGMKNGYAYTYYPNGQVCRKAKYKNNRLVN
jgi:antitoxin component YwqK of YwqJK toxin-antitoxin module